MEMLSLCILRFFPGFTIVITSLWPYLQLVCMTCGLPKVLLKKKKEEEFVDLNVLLFYAAI